MEGTQYIFGHDGNAMILKTVGATHTDLSGHLVVVAQTDVDETTHTCDILRKYRSFEGADGTCYDVYLIGGYYRDTDRTVRTDKNVAALEAENKLLKEQVSAQADQAEFYEDCIAEMAAVVYA